MQQPVDRRIARLVLLAVPLLLAVATTRRMIGAVWDGPAKACATSLHPSCAAFATSGPMPGNLYRNAGELLFSLVAWCFLYRLTQRR